MVVGTRNQKKMEAFGDLIDKKLGEFKDVLVNQFQTTLDAYINEKKAELGLFFDTKIKEIEETALKNISKVADSTVVNDELRESIKSIENHVMAVKHDNIILRNQVDDLHQYIRRPNLRIFGVPVPPGEKSQHVEDFIQTLIQQTEIPSSSVDRAHCVGRVTSKVITNKDVGDGGDGEDDEVGDTVEKTVIKTQPIIVRFATFRDRTTLYRARKQIKEKFNCSISLDLTADRYSLLKYARKKVENVAGIQFVYADINCALRAFTTEGKHLFFDSVCALDDIISATIDSAISE